MEDAISQLQVLGVTRGQAKKALARYNNDVARAADYIFSTNNLSDDETEENTIESDAALALRLSTEEEQMQKSFQRDEALALKLSTEEQQMQDSFHTTNDDSSQSDLQPPPPPPPAAAATATSQQATTVPEKNADPFIDTSIRSVVPYKSPSSIVLPPNNHFSTTSKITIENSLTWWSDPEDPSERLALDDTPIGLRPPSYNFPYAPILIQALFHVTAFQQAVLSFRPVPYGWGAPNNYWKGFGDPVPGYIMKQVVKQVAIRNIPPPPPPPSTEPSEQIEDLISLDSSSRQASPSSPIYTDDEQEVEDMEIVEEESSEINEIVTAQDLPPVKNIEKFVDQVENDIQIMPNCLQALSEMQKLFAFLGYSRRLYGNVSHYVRALNHKMSNGWEYNDQTFESFLEMVIHGLVEADEQSEAARNPAFVPIFRNMFLVKARIEDGDEYDDDEVYYLSLSVDQNMCSLHDCLDPLVFESYQLITTEDVQPPSPRFKFTTFKQIPPLLMVLLDNNNNNNKYMIDKTIYMDRYMMENKHKALEGFQQMDLCRKEIIKSRAEIAKLKCDSQFSMDKRDVLYHTMNYFEQENMNMLASLKSVLIDAKQKIESRLEALENNVMDQQEKMHHLFDDMKEHGYDLRASFHHDGKSGTGHYWAYIWTEEESLLQDIPIQGGWYKFCDAQVTMATETEMEQDPYPPFAVMYASTPQFTKAQLYTCLPEELKDFIMTDNYMLEQEINAYITSEEVDQIGSSFGEMDISSEEVSVGTAVGGLNHDDEQQRQQYSYKGDQAYQQLKDCVNTKIIQISNYSNDDYRLLKSFEIFLAKIQNQLLLERLYLLYSSEQDGVVDEEASKNDDNLKSMWHEYESFLSIAKKVTQALTYFTNKQFFDALQSLLDSKRHEAAWKVSSGLEPISFHSLIETYGKACLKHLNDIAFFKASHESYRTQGLQDALNIAHQARSIIGPEEEVYMSLREKWLSFTEQLEVGTLNESQEVLLNELIMTYLEGRSDDSRNESSSPVSEDEDKNDVPLWQKYQQLCIESEKLLIELNNK